MTIDEAIKFCDEKSKNIKLKTEPQTFIDIVKWLEELKESRKGINEIPIVTITINKEDLQKMVDEKIKDIKLDIQAIRNKAIDVFAERLYHKIKSEIDDCADELDWIDEIAEQLKAGEVE